MPEGTCLGGSHNINAWGLTERGGPILGGVVLNPTDCRIALDSLSS